MYVRKLLAREKDFLNLASNVVKILDKFDLSFFLKGVKSIFSSDVIKRLKIKLILYTIPFFWCKIKLKHCPERKVL